MAKSLVKPEFMVERDRDLCIQCEVCVRQCSNLSHEYDRGLNMVITDHTKCVGCQRCVQLCPTNAIRIREFPVAQKPHAIWTTRTQANIRRQADQGGMLLSAMGADLPYTIYWDHILLNASQVTNPSIDPLREPMELDTHLGRKPDRVSVDAKTGKLDTKMARQLHLKAPIMFSAMSYGSISRNACLSLARAAREFGTFWNTGEGGLHPDFYEFGPHTIVQVASGRFGVHPEYLAVGAAVEIKMGQGAKPGIGGHLPGEKVNEDISITRMIPQGTDALSPAPHHDIYSIEDLQQLIYALKEATNYEKPISVKIAAVHNVSAIASGIVRAGADIVAIDGLRGGTGAAPSAVRDNVGLPIELALAAVDTRLREEGIRNQASLVAAGGFRNSADVVKAICLGADAVYVATSALVAMGCHVCQKCYTGKCNWGIATQDPKLVKRLNPNIGARRLCNLLRAWSLEIKEMMGGMGINAIQSLRGNRNMLRGVHLTDWELDTLGIAPAGR